jgi:hypothetical protein
VRADELGVVEHRVQPTAQEVGHGAAAVAIGHVQHFDAGRRGQQRVAEVPRGAGSGRGDGDRAAARELKELRHRAGPELRTHHQQDPSLAVADDGREVPHRVVLQVAHQVRVDGVGADCAEQEGGAVGRLLRDVQRGDGAAGPGAVVDCDGGGRAEAARHLRRDQPPDDIGAGAGGEGDD